MKCQNCGNHEAMFHYKSNINGAVAEQHLCRDCAETMEGSVFAGNVSGNMLSAFENNILNGGFLQRDFFGGLTDDMFFSPLRMPAFMGGFPTAGETVSSENPVSAEPAEKQIPGDAGNDFKKRRELNRLRYEMKAAARSEDFERAAQLRDQICRMESEDNSK